MSDNPQGGYIIPKNAKEQFYVHDVINLKLKVDEQATEIEQLRQKLSEANSMTNAWSDSAIRLTAELDAYKEREKVWADFLRTKATGSPSLETFVVQWNELVIERNALRTDNEHYVQLFRELAERLHRIEQVLDGMNADADRAIHEIKSNLQQVE